MEIKAENKYTLSEKLFREGMGRVNRDSYGAAVRKALIVMAVLWAVLASITVFSSGHLFFALIELLVMGAAAWTLAVSIPKSRVKKAWAAMQERSGGEMERHIRFYEDRLEVAPGNTVVKYADVAKAYETAQLLILITTENAGILVPKDGFITGGPETVLGLLDKWRTQK